MLLFLKLEDVWTMGMDFIGVGTWELAIIAALMENATGFNITRNGFECCGKLTTVHVACLHHATGSMIQNQLLKPFKVLIVLRRVC